MKKFLLLFLPAFMAIASYAQVDTVLFEPGKPGNYELKVDTEKYPYLNMDNVSWFLGNGDYSREIEDSEIQIIDEKYQFIKESGADSWKNIQGTNPRTCVVYYSATISPTKNSETTIKDTVAVLHILKDLNTVTPETEDQLISDFTVNEKGWQAGDTAKFTATLADGISELDIQQYALVSGEDIISVSDTGYFEVVPEETIKDIMLVVSNKTGLYTFEGWPKTLKVYPKFNVSNLIYTTSSNGKTTTIENPDVTETSVNIFNHDSVSLVVKTNFEETLTQEGDKVSYTWNKDGKDLPEGIEVDGDTLIIPEYVKPEMDGVYNCFVSNGDTTIVASFKCTSEYPTSNEVINTTYVTSTSNNIVCNGVANKEVKIYNYMGMMVYSNISNSDRINIEVPSGIYLVSIDHKVTKIKVK